MEWSEFALAYGAFFLSHSIPVRPPVRPWLQRRLGEGGFTLAYSVLSLGVLAWLIGAAGRAPHVPLWGWAAWQAWVPLVVMLPVCLILALAILRPNPFSFGGTRNDEFDPSHPGIVRWTRHPLLVALALWAAAHMVPNGDVAHGILFGTFAAFAILGQWLIDRRKRREMGPTWQEMRRAVARAPRVSSGLTASTVWRIAAGVALYGALIWLHPVMLGVSPLT
jgi:uncharacterized membrane protein